MRKYFILLLPLMWACGNHEHDHDLDHHHGHDHEHEHVEAEHAHEGEEEHAPGEIIVEPEMAELMGVTTETVNPAPFSAVIASTGTVTRSAGSEAAATAPVSGTVHYLVATGKAVGAGAAIARINSDAVSGGDSNRAARAAMEAAKAELDRLTPLYDERLVTAADYQAAVGAYEQARAAYSAGASTGTAAAPIAGTVATLSLPEGAYVNAGDPVATISSNARLTLRVDVAERHLGDLASVHEATVQLPSGMYTAAVNPAAVTSLSPGYATLFLDVNAAAVPGSAAKVWLLGKPSADVISVPLTALSEQQGRYFVYVQLDEEGYEKRPVTLGASDGKRVVIASGLTAGESVVVTGTTTVRLAESSGAIPEGHSHNH